MNITLATKKLIEKIQPLKLKYTDLASQTFIDFYCQCRQGCDYLFPLSVKNSVTVLQILDWFLISVDQGRPYILVQLMWKDVIGPTLTEYQDDENIEHNLNTIFSQPQLKEVVQTWDLKRLSDGQVFLTLRELLHDISDIEQMSVESVT